MAALTTEEKAEKLAERLGGGQALILSLMTPGFACDAQDRTNLRDLNLLRRKGIAKRRGNVWTLTKFGILVRRSLIKT